jgi:5-methylcytosine-specific restriction enzyme B
MPRDPRPEVQPVYAAAERFVEAALRSDGSLFTPGRPVFTAANLRELHTRFKGDPQKGAESFLTKFQGQLDGASDLVVQLAAEALYAHLMFAQDIGGPSKRATLGTVLGWMRSPVTIPPELDEALDVGLANTAVHRDDVIEL